MLKLPFFLCDLVAKFILGFFQFPGMIWSWNNADTMGMPFH